MTSQLEQLIEQVNGATFISIDTETTPKLPGGKKNPNQGRITKVMTGANVMVFQNKSVNGYEAMVNRRLEKEGFTPSSFSVGPRTWGIRRPNTPFVDHNDNIYLEVIFLKAGKVSYLLDGQPTDERFEEVAHTEGEQGGLDNKVIIRTFNVDNIKTITINGQRHNL